mmetsp:Transcript_2792/g.6488  ORF Transcript_2792/g.6488 Transcript_2792/m.6488 type:complete len:223 (+) Transcript_2792:686-1354(+)
MGLTAPEILGHRLVDGLLQRVQIGVRPPRARRPLAKVLAGNLAAVGGGKPNQPRSGVARDQGALYAECAGSAHGVRVHSRLATGGCQRGVRRQQEPGCERLAERGPVERLVCVLLRAVSPLVHGDGVEDPVDLRALPVDMQEQRDVWVAQVDVGPAAVAVAVPVPQGVENGVLERQTRVVGVIQVAHLHGPRPQGAVNTQRRILSRLVPGENGGPVARIVAE